MKKVIEVSRAIAEAVKLANVKVVASYPITPQTHIPESLAQLQANGLADYEFLNVESEHSALSACIGAQASGVRTFTATASQGLALMHELLFIASGMRLPIVMAVANRALSAPLNIWCDWSDSIASRDSGWIQLYCETGQEAFDTILQAYKIAEDEKVLLPVMVCIDGFFLSHVFEPVDIPEKKLVEKFLPKYSATSLSFDKPITQGSWASPETYQGFKKQQDEAMDYAIEAIQKVNSEFSRKFGRSYGNGLIDITNKDAKYFIISMGSVCGTIKHFLESEKTKDVGLIRIKSYRPFPKDELKKIIKNKKVAVLEKDIGPGFGGALANDVRTIIRDKISSYIGGLGGKDITLNHIKEIIENLRANKEIIKWLD